MRGYIRGRIRLQPSRRLEKADSHLPNLILNTSIDSSREYRFSFYQRDSSRRQAGDSTACISYASTSFEGMHSLTMIRFLLLANSTPQMAACLECKPKKATRLAARLLLQAITRCYEPYADVIRWYTASLAVIFSCGLEPCNIM